MGTWSGIRKRARIVRGAEAEALRRANIALGVMERYHWFWRNHRFSIYPFLKRHALKSRTQAIVFHDRALDIDGTVRVAQRRRIWGE